MRINEIILLEAKTSHGIILKNCSQFLKESKMQPLWRGGDDPAETVTGFYDEKYGDDVYRMRQIKKRRISTSTIENLVDDGLSHSEVRLLYAKIDELMIKKYGLGRTNTKQFTGDKGEASTYSTKSLSNLCFPIDGYKYLWSVQTNDYIRALGSGKNIIGKVLSKYGHDDDFNVYNEKIILEIALSFVRKIPYKSNNLAHAIKSGHEILIQGPWYLVDAENPKEFYGRLNS